eukprot:m.177041 g.177041  ORF g.177041 m.177041 type:complete len:59 (+) comp16568_c2_seq1:777-953(+)
MVQLLGLGFELAYVDISTCFPLNQRSDGIGTIDQLHLQAHVNDLLLISLIVCCLLVNE